MMEDTRPRGEWVRFWKWEFRFIYAHGMAGGGWDEIEVRRVSR